MINASQRAFYPTAQAPTAQSLKPELDWLGALLSSNGVHVERPRTIPGIKDQLTPRDIGFVIGDTFFVSNMSHPSRREEWRGIEELLKRQPALKVVHFPDDATVEGGDIIVDRDCVFVGTGNRTNDRAVAFLQGVLAQSPFKVVPVPLADCTLHLDCSFNPLGEHALIYPAGLSEIPPELHRYNWIVATDEEQRELAVNVLMLSPDTVISRDTSVRLNRLMAERGLRVYAVPFDETPKTGGSFRCAVLPLRREEPAPPTPVVVDWSKGYFSPSSPSGRGHSFADSPAR